MHPVGGMFTPTEEVDEVRWVAPADASRLLSYERDLTLLEVLLA
jgi:8-oxo-dGTP diphosphatase